SVRSTRAETVAATPAINQAAPEGKKTLRKGNVIITGASSGLGLATAKAPADFLRAERAAKSASITKQPLDALVCNAAVYLPTAKEPTFTAEGFEHSIGTNHLGYYLLARLLLDDIIESDFQLRRLIIVGSITGNTNTLAGNVPPKANLRNLRGLAGGIERAKVLNTSAMINGGDFDGAKAYKDSKVCNMLTIQEFHRRFNEDMQITFSSLYPGGIATTGLSRENIPFFWHLFPPFQRYTTRGYVSEEEAGQRQAQIGQNR
ncbi:hypothetical protein RJ639_046029, partial [Escallonia herrerae]